MYPNFQEINFHRQRLSWPICGIRIILFTQTFRKLNYASPVIHLVHDVFEEMMLFLMFIGETE